MKKVLFLIVMMGGFSLQAQSNDVLIKHYEAFYKQMRMQGDLQGSINALTHLTILQPNQARKDTLAYLYFSVNKYIPALNVLGIEKDANASKLALEVKAASLKSVNQAERSLEQYELLFQKYPDIYVAYEMVDLQIQAGKYEEATKSVEYGLANCKEEDMIAFYETQNPYQVPAKAAFTYMKGLTVFNKDQTKVDEALALVKEAIVLAPDFNLAKTIRQALLNRKAEM